VSGICQDAQGLTGSGHCTDPDFASTDPSSADYLRLTASSPAIDKGVPVPVFDDFWGNPRPFGNAPDLGIQEYGSVAGVIHSPRQAMLVGCGMSQPGPARVYDLRGRVVGRDKLAKAASARVIGSVGRDGTFVRGRGVLTGNSHKSLFQIRLETK
jgi:hypothetical protein